MEIPDRLPRLLKNLYASQETIVRTGYRTMDWLKIGKGVHQGYILSPCLFNFYTEYIMQNASWINHKLEWELLGKYQQPQICRWYHLNCLLRNMYAGQEATVRTRHGTMDWLQIGKVVPQGCILPPCLFNLHPVYLMRNAGLDEESRFPGEILMNSHMQMTPLWKKAKRN